MFSSARLRIGTAAVLCVVMGSGSVMAETTIIAANTGPITLNDGLAAPYPSTVVVSGIASNRVDRVEARLVLFSHAFPDDIDLLLVGPAGQRVVLMSDAGGSSAVSDLTLTFKASAATAIPDSTALASNDYRPANYEAAADNFPAPGPGSISGTTALSVFNGTNPNGTWSLYAIDDGAQDVGSISQGWRLFLTVPDVRVVTKIADTNDGVCNADCSLREAIAAADPFDIVDFSELFETPQTIVLGGTELLIDKSLSLKGPGANLLTVSGNFASRVFHLPPSIVVNISGLTIAEGRNLPNQSGGGIFSAANLTLSGVSVTGNISDFDGGGVFNSGTMTISGSTIADNTTRHHGGGVMNGSASTLTLIDSTVSRNSADEGGGVIQRSAGSTTLLRTTVTQNAVTRFGGGGVQRQSGTVNLQNSIVAGNLKAQFDFFANSADVFSDFGAGAGFTSSGYNLIGDIGAVAGVFTQTGDQAGSGGATIDPRLGPLMLGGGSTPTHALLGGSPAIDKGNASTAVRDQRGQTRPFDTPGVPPATGGDSSDIGAVEMQTLIVSNANDAGAGSLRDALTLANANGESLEDIVFDATFFSTPRTIPLVAALPVIDSRLTLNGPGAGFLAVRRDVPAAFRIFTVNERQLNLSVSGMTIANGRAPVDFGGGVSSNSDLHLSEVAVTGNFSQFGGGVAVRNGSSVISRSTISGNEAEGGGGLYFGAQSSAARLRLELSTISGGTSSVPGGGGILHSTSSGTSALEVIGCTITQNGGFFGGGVVMRTSVAGDSATTVFRNSIVVNNTSGFSSDLYSEGPGSESFESRGFNLSNDSGGSVFLRPTDLESATPLLGGLAQNGGQTATHALLPGSPAIDRGQRSGANFDQRARTRPYDDPAIPNAATGDGTDMGAFEFRPELLFASGFE